MATKKENTKAEATEAKTTKEKMVKVKLPIDRSRKVQRIYVGVNGRAMFIPLGEEVEIPELFYNALMDRERALEARLKKELEQNK